MSRRRTRTHGRDGIAGRRRATASALVAAGLVASLLPAGGAVAQERTDAILFPSDTLTVPDATQVTGRRVELPLPDCAVAVSDCNDIRLLNQLDGFDLDPRIAIQLATVPADIDATFTADVLYVEPVAGGDRIGLNRFVLDPSGEVLFGQPRELLAESTTYRLVYDAPDGRLETTFTTLTATQGLAQMRAQLDDGRAYDAAGIPAAERGLDLVRDDGTRTVFDAPDVVRMTRYDQRTDVCDDLTAEQILNPAVAAARSYGFGSFRSPSWLDPDRTIPQPSTATGEPVVQGSEEVGFTIILPAGAAPAEGWPVAIFGPGITRSKYDLFLAADTNAARGVATLSLDPVGHAYGACSEVGVELLSGGGEELRFSGFGRGFDQDGDGVITDQEGVSAPVAPHPKSNIALRDGLRQTAADVMALVRAIGAGSDIDGDGVDDLDADDVALYAQSLGGIYSTMVMGVETRVPVAILNVPGGPILEIARLSPVFRSAVRQQLEQRVPCVLNGGVNAFTESQPLYLDPAVTAPVAGALTIQRIGSWANWLNRPGSPETFAPLLRDRPLADTPGPKEIHYQFALGDQTVPNPTSATIMRAGNLQDRTSFYRNDLTVTRDTNPHGFLLDPRVQGRNQGQQQVIDFITSDGATVTDPDGPAPTWEVPIIDPDLLEVNNFSDDLYADPEPAPAGCGVEAAAPAGPDEAPEPGLAVDDGAGLPATGGGAGLLGFALMALGATVTRRS